MKNIPLSLLCLMFLCGCRSWWQDPEPEEPPPGYVGIVRQVNRAEHYLIFETIQSFPPGTEVRILRNGRKIGTARVTDQQEKKFQVADILSGAPAPGDLCERQPSRLAPSLEPQPGQ